MVNGIVSIASDVAVPIASYVAERMGSQVTLFKQVNGPRIKMK